MNFIYTKKNCLQCDATKTMFADLDINYTEIKLDNNPEAIETVKKLGYLSAPVIITETDSWAGFNYEKINSLVP